MNNKLKSITINENEKFLRQISKPVDIKNDKELNTYIKILDLYCKENNVMAMAAVQLGIPKRIVYLKNTNLDIINKMQNNSQTEAEQAYNESRVLINPTIINKEGITEYWEACASCLDNCGKVLRPYIINLKYYDKDGKEKIEKFEGFESTVLSHELDHLDGILHMDIAEELLIMNRDERKKWRQSHEYTIYSKNGDYDSLKKYVSDKIKLGGIEMNDTTIKNALSYALGSDLHEAWRAPRKKEDGTYEPRIKKSKDDEWNITHGTDEVDIANCTFEQLPSNWQYENLEAARVAIELVYDKTISGEKFTTEEIEEMASVIHDEWLNRNQWVYDPEYGDPKLAVPYTQLSQEEQDKDKAQLGPAQVKVQDYIDGLIDIEKICEQYSLSTSSKQL